MLIPFTKPRFSKSGLRYIQDVLEGGRTWGGGFYTKKVHSFLEQHLKVPKVLLTNSGTAALEMAALLLDLPAGSEIIMPSWTFVSTANAFALRGLVPVFAEVNEFTYNLDPESIEASITPNTRAIVVVHYAGVACDMDSIMKISEKYGLYVIEDAAQGVWSNHNGRPLGSIGHLGCYSFHGTKNISSGEGGALIINDKAFEERAEIIWEKGTDRSKFISGFIDKYTWVDLGSSYLPSELTAASLWSQFELADEITEYRLQNWNYYRDAFSKLMAEAAFKIPKIPDYSQHNAHIFYLELSSNTKRDAFISKMKNQGIETVFHYTPLHNSVAGTRYGKCRGNLQITERIAAQMVRLPMWSESGLPVEAITNSALEILQDMER